MELFVQKNIESVINRLKYLETIKCRKEMTKEQINQSKKITTEMFRLLLIHRDKLNKDEIYRMTCDLYI
jgi:hypothetical protein